MRRRAQQGFTLLELLVAVAILGVVMSMIYATFYRTIASKEYVERGNDIYSMARIAMERMGRELGMAFLSDAEEERNFTLFLGENHELEDYPADSLTFTSVSHQQYLLNVRESDQNELSYYVAEESETGVRALMYREDVVIDQDNTEGGAVYEL